MEKCDGTLTIENKKKKAMIDELARKGYDSDPVKQWKLKQDREAVLVSVAYFSDTGCLPTRKSQGIL